MNNARPELRYEITFPSSDAAEGNIYVKDLAEFLESLSNSEDVIKTEPIRTNPEAQDFGASLAVILGTAAVTALAKGVAAWLKGHTGVNMDVTTRAGHVVIRNVESKSAAEIVRALANGGAG